MLVVVAVVLRIIIDLNHNNNILNSIGVVNLVPVLPHLPVSVPPVTVVAAVTVVPVVIVKTVMTVVPDHRHDHHLRPEDLEAGHREAVIPAPVRVVDHVLRHQLHPVTGQGDLVTKVSERT